MNISRRATVARQAHIEQAFTQLSIASMDWERFDSLSLDEATTLAKSCERWKEFEARFDSESDLESRAHLCRWILSDEEQRLAHAAIAAHLDAVAARWDAALRVKAKVAA